MDRHHPSMLVHIYFKFHEILPGSYWDGCGRGFFNKSRAITLKKIDQSKQKMEGHHPSMLVHIYFKFHKILPGSYWEMAADGRDGCTDAHMHAQHHFNIPLPVNRRGIIKIVFSLVYFMHNFNLSFVQRSIVARGEIASI